MLKLSQWLKTCLISFSRSNPSPGLTKDLHTAWSTGSPEDVDFYLASVTHSVTQHESLHLLKLWILTGKIKTDCNVIHTVVSWPWVTVRARWEQTDNTGESPLPSTVRIANVRADCDYHTVRQIWTQVCEIVFASQQHYMQGISPTKHTAISRCFTDSGMITDYCQHMGKGKEENSPTDKKAKKTFNAESTKGRHAFQGPMIVFAIGKKIIDLFQNVETN